MLPTQTQTIATYCLLALIAVEAVLMWHLERYHEVAEEQRRRSLAQLRFVSGRSPATQAAAAAAIAEVDRVAAAEVAAADKESAAGAAGRGSGRMAELLGACWGGECACSSCPPETLQPGGGGSSGPQDARRCSLLRLGQLKEELQREPALGAYWAARVERWCLLFLLAGYTAATILVFALSAGYVDLFPELK